MNKPEIIIYVNPDSNSTRLLNQFIARHIDQINTRVYIKTIQVNQNNLIQVRKMGIDRTPTLVHNKKKYVGLDQIMQILKPPTETRDGFGTGNLSPDEMIHKFQSDFIQEEGDELDEDDPANRDSVLKQKMLALQRRRPQMDAETADKTKLAGGKKLKTSGQPRTSFNSDDDFRRASGVDIITETPVRRYTAEEDGNMILEDYYLEEANMTGKRVKNTRRKSYH